MKTGLVLEGGALRTIFSSGVCDAFLNEKLPMPDYTIGVSAGIAYGVSYLSRQKRRNLQLLMHYANDRRYMGWGNFFDPRNRSYFGLKFAYDTIPNELVPFDYDTFEAYPGQVEAVVTNLQTGRAEYREVPRRDASFLLLQATCAMPVLFQPIRLDDGAPYLDGGCSDAIPWKRALAVGCDRVVVVLTRERSYRKEPEQLMPLFRRVYRKYPVFLEGLRTRAERYNQCREELFALEQEGRVLVIAPANTRGFSRTERDRQKILALWRTASSPAAGLRRRCGTPGRGRHLPLGHRNSSRPPPIFQWAAVSSWRKWFCTRNPYCFLRFTIFLRKFYKILEILFPACRFAYIMLERSIHDRIGPAVPDGLEYWERKAQLWTFSPSLPSAAAWRSSCTA